MADNVIALAEGFRSQLIHADAQAIMAMSRAWTGVEAALQTAVNDMAQQIADLKAKGEDVPQWKLWQMSQYQSLLAQIAGEMSKYSQGAIADIQDQQIKAQQLGQDHAKQMLLAAMGGQRALSTAFDKLPAGAVENITALAQAGQPLHKLLENAYPTAVAGLTQELLYGTAIGRNPRETARIAVRKGLAGGLNHILLVARDQQIRNYREMTRQRYKDSGVVYGYMRLAARNTRTCLACIALDGTVYETGQVMALHPQDRCSMIPLVEGFPLPQIKPASEWFKGLDEDEQRRMMGNGRFEAWRDGLFQFRQLATVGNHPVWGPSAKVTSLTDLLKGRGGLGGAPIDPAALLKSHKGQKPAKPQKPQSLAVDNGDKKLLQQMVDDLAQAKLDGVTYKAIEGTLSKIMAGQQGMVYTASNGRVEGALAYEPGKGNLNYLQITAAGFADADANKKGILDAAGLAQQKGQGLQLYVPNSHMALYKGWGFTVHHPLKDGAQMRLRPDDVGGFLKDPDNYGQVKIEKLSQAAKDALADPAKAFTFRSGQEIPGLPFKPVHMDGADFEAQAKVLPYDPPLQIDDPNKHAAAGMLLFTPDGKLVVVDPAGEYGGYKTTFPKGTQEDGMSLQATAVKEVWEETGFKAKVLGHLGDYEKSTSLTRFYVGVVEDGAPWAAHYESEAVRIVPLDQVDALLNVGADKDILQDLLKFHKSAIGDGPFSTAKLEKWLDELGEIEQLMAIKNSLTIPPPAAGVKKANDYVEQVVKSGKYTAEDILAAVQTHFPKSIFTLENVESKFAKLGIQQPPPADIPALQAAEPTTLPLPPEDPATLTKKALMEHLAQVRGIASWKLSVMKKEEIAALFALPEAEALAAIEAAGKAHGEKYPKKKAAQTVPPETAAFNKYQSSGADSLTAEEAKLAMAYARQEGVEKAVLLALKTHYQAQIGDPLIDLKTDTPLGFLSKADIVTAFHDTTGMSVSALNMLNKTYLVSLVGKPTSHLYDALGQPFTPKAASPLPPGAPEPTAVTPPPPEPEPPAKADPVDMKQWGTSAVSDFSAKLGSSFAPGSPAHKGVIKAIDNLAAMTHSGFGYSDDTGSPTGLITFKQVDTDTMKVTGAAFVNTAVNQEALADVANVALSQGLKLVTYVPNALMGQYKKWGFKADSTIGNGAYMEMSLADMPAFVTAAGKKAKSAPKPAQKQAAQEKDDAVSAIGTPGDVKAATAVKLSKDALIAHLANKSGVPASKLQKYTKQTLVQFMEMDAPTAIDLMQKGGAPPPPPSPIAPPTAAPVQKKRPLPENLPAFQLPDPPGFPADVGGMRTVSSLGGSTGARLVEDPATGKRYVLKKGNSAGHLKEEAYADAAYQALGLNVPTFKVYETADGPVKLAEYKAGMKTLGQALNDASPAERKAIVAEVRKGFAADALLGNWDVVGASKDNILVGDDGKVWRIDNGGSFRYRAQGAKKDKEFLNDYPVELWTLRDKKVGPENAQIFGDMDIYEIMDQAKDVVAKGEALLAAVPDELRPLVNGRLEVMRDLVGTSDAFKADKWKAGYTDGFLEQSTYIRREGLIDKMPQQMKQPSKGSTSVYDENGREFDVLRGKASHVEAWAAYCNANGGDPGIIRYWMSSQASSSWSDASQALKYRIAQDRGGSFSAYFWKSGLDYARKQYEATINKVGKEKYDKTWAMWHAWVYESLRHMEFARKNGGVVELVRTEGSDVMKGNGVKLGAQNALMNRGAAESASIYRAKRIVAGGEVTRQRVPLHRVLGYYWGDRPGSPGSQGGFLGDSENEFVFIPEGIPFDYVDSIQGSKGAESYW